MFVVTGIPRLGVSPKLLPSRVTFPTCRLTTLLKLFPRLPLFAGVIVTVADVLIVLVFFGTSNGRQGMLLLEIVIVSLVSASLRRRATHQIRAP